MRLDFRGAPAAALLTPRTASGGVDYAAFERNLEFAIGRGVSGVVVGGATGEYGLASIEERERLFETALLHTAGRCLALAGIGATGIAESVVLGKHAVRKGADAVLLPPPHFFRYSQEDLEAFYREAAREIAAPVILYNLPAFTTGLEKETVVRLIESVPNIIGLKDSSGELEILGELTRRPELGACRLIGNDGALREGIDGGCCDSAVSGIAGVLPELSVGVFDVRRQTASLAKVDELLKRLDRFPTPWGLKVIAQFRGLFEARFPLPLSEARKRQIAELDEWFAGWWTGEIPQFR